MQEQKDSVIVGSEPKRLTVRELMKLRLRQDDLFTVLYAYVRKYSPTQDDMLYEGDDQTKDELKTKAYQIAKEIKTNYHLNLTKTVDHVTRLVRDRQYGLARKYIRQRVHELESEIKALG